RSEAASDPAKVTRTHQGVSRPLNALQTCGKKSVEPGHACFRFRPVARQRAQFAWRGDEPCKAWKFGCRDRIAPDPGVAVQYGCDDVLAFFGFERAGGEHDGTARPRQID